MSSARTCAWPSAAPEQQHGREGNNCPEVSKGHQIKVSQRETMHSDPHGSHVLPGEFNMKFRYLTKVLLRILNPQIKILNL